MNKEILEPMKIKKYWKNQKPPNIQKLRERNEKFVDTYFPPNENSLSSKDENNNYIDKERGEKRNQELLENYGGSLKDIKWKRPKEIKPDVKWELFEGKIEFSDVNQGNLGDCYFLSSVTALTEYPYIIQEKFRTKKYNEEGYYEIIFFIDGEWQIVFVDDLFPYDSLLRDWTFARPHGSELWSMLLEKAWAKINGGYSLTIGGFISEAICPLTGFPADHIWHKEKMESNCSEFSDFDMYDLFNMIEECHKEGCIMSSGSLNKNNQELTGIVPGHAYTLIGAKRFERDKIYLLKIRNPWGATEWKGDWSDNSSCWTPEYKNYFGLEKKEDGVFWMSIKDYFSHFASTDICHIFYGAIVKSFYFEYETYFKKPIVFNFYIKEQSKFSFRVIFKNWRFNRNIQEPNHPFTLVIGEYDENRKIKKLYSKYSLKNDIDFVRKLKPGYYVAWLYCVYEEVKNDNNFKFSVQISSTNTFDVQFLGPDKDFKLLQYLLLENYMIEGAENINSCREYFLGSYQKFDKSGLKNILIYNKTGQSLEVLLSCNVYGLTFLPPYKDMSDIKITIPPYEREAIVGLPTLCYYYCSINDTVNMKNDGGNYGKTSDENKEVYYRFLNFDISNNSNPDALGLRVGEYKYIKFEEAKKIPKFDKTQIFDNKTMRMTTIIKTKITPETLSKEFPKEIKLLLDNFPNDESPGVSKGWDKIQMKDGIYLGEVNSITNELEGRGVFTWETSIKYVGLWQKNEMSGRGMLFIKNNSLLFEGNYINSKRNGKGKLYVKDKEYIESNYINDIMGQKGVYHFENGDKWEGFFLNNKRNGVGLMIKVRNGDVSLVEYENDYYMGSVPLSKEEKENFENLGKTQMKKALDIEKKKQEEEQNQQIDKNNQNNLANTIYTKKKTIRPAANVERIDFKVEETSEEKKHKMFIENLSKYSKLEPFMVQKFLALRPLGYEEDLKYFKINNTKYFGGGIAKPGGNEGEIIKTGRGVFFNGNSYYCGIWDNDKTNGFFLKYNSKKQLTLKGFLSPGFKINPKIPCYLYQPSGEIFHGFFVNNQINGLGIYYFLKGDSWTGNFIAGKFNGKGKYFYDNGFLCEERTFNNGSLVSKGKVKRDDLIDPNSYNFFNTIRINYPGVIEKLLLLPPYRETEENLLWTTFNSDDGSIYIGQVNSNKQKMGKCCIINRKNTNPYFFGYYIEQKISGKGYYYDNSWNLVFEGEFENNKKNGFGIYNYPNGTKYVGYFNDDIPNKKGVIYFKNGVRFEGRMKNGKKNDKGYIININKQTKQEITSKNGNVIHQGDIFSLKGEKFMIYYNKNFNEFKENGKALGYEKYLYLLFKLEPTYDSFTVKPGIKIEMSEVYIGEMNSIGFKHGRGVLLEQNKGSFYVGYFVDDLKNGKGTLYKKFDVPIYIGEFVNDKPLGEGEYIHSNGDSFKGNFNAAGEGNGIYTFANGDYWKGQFYAWTLHGTGEFYSKGNLIGKKTFEYNKVLQ